MNKKEYIKPTIDIIRAELAGFICLSYGIRDNNPEDDNYIVPPTVAGEATWTEKEDDGGGIWGDLD